MTGRNPKPSEIDPRKCVCGSSKSRGSTWCWDCAHLGQRNAPDPTQDEIKAICAEIQKEWTPEEKRRRHYLTRSEDSFYARIYRYVAGR